MEQIAQQSLQSVQKLVKNSLIKHFTQVCSQYKGLNISDLKLSNSKNKDIDYQSPAIMQIYNQNKKILIQDFKKPDDFIQKIVKEFKPDETVSNLEIGERNFLNIKLQDSFIEKQIQQILNIGCVHPQQEKQSIIAVDFSSPNIAKELHVGHLRSTVIGESISRILEYTGQKVHRINHIGDWGTQFGMLINQLKQSYPDFLQNMPDIQDLDKFYKQAKTQFKENQEFKKTSQLTVVQLQSGDEECLKAWKLLCDVSRQFFNTIYTRLDINVKEKGESTYNEQLPGIVQELIDKNLLEQEENGAKVVRIPGYKTPVIVQKEDGGYNYSTTDLAAFKHRLFNLNCDRLIYFTDQGQKLHFELIFKTVEKLNWKTPKEYSAEHAWFGLVLDENGQKYKSSEGDSVKLADVLDEAKSRALKQILERSKQNDLNKEQQENSGTKIDSKDYEEAAEIMGISAVKYFEQSRTQDYKFIYDKMLDTKGNTAVYLLYAYARINSILQKSGLSEQQIQESKKNVQWKITHPFERQTAVQLIKFTDVVEDVSQNIKINFLTDYIYEVASKVSEGYKQYKILGDKDTQTRLLLCEAIKIVMKQSFYLVGIKPLDKI